MNALDWLVLLGTMIGIAVYGLWQTRGRQNLTHYLHGDTSTGWLTIGLSVMATQASAITFLSIPGQGYQDGLGFVQNYFGAPLALIIIAAVFLPIFRRLKVDTAYEYLGRRFDRKTRLLGAALFLIQRGLGAGITIYAPAIVLSTVMGWRLDVTIVSTGLVVVAYTAVGGSKAVSLTQRYQIAVIFAGMVTAFVVLVTRLPAGVTFTDALTIGGGLGKLEAVDFSIDPQRRYTMWSGLLGGMFLALAYFGTDQSQVQRYLAGASLRESRLGLMFNAVFKIPMQFFILLLGALLFVFYQFERPPVFFNQTGWQLKADAASPAGEHLRALAAQYATAHAEKQQHIRAWIDARHSGDRATETTARTAAQSAHAESETIRDEARELMSGEPGKKANDADYVFITFILGHLPHGVIGLLVAVFFAATLSSKAGELNALGSTTAVDFYRTIIHPDRRDAHYVSASRWLTAAWGFVAIGFALYANLVENLIQAVNIVGSIFNGVVLGLFLVAFFLKRVGGNAVFWGALAAQSLVLVVYFLRHLYPIFDFSYLWHNLIGCVACVLFSLMLHAFLGPRDPLEELPAA